MIYINKLTSDKVDKIKDTDYAQLSWLAHQAMGAKVKKVSGGYILYYKYPSSPIARWDFGWPTILSRKTNCFECSGLGTGLAFLEKHTTNIQIGYRSGLKWYLSVLAENDFTASAKNFNALIAKAIILWKVKGNHE